MLMEVSMDSRLSFFYHYSFNPMEHFFTEKTHFRKRKRERNSRKWNCYSQPIISIKVLSISKNIFQTNFAFVWANEKKNAPIAVFRESFIQINELESIFHTKEKPQIANSNFFVCKIFIGSAWFVISVLF